MGRSKPRFGLPLEYQVLISARRNLLLCRAALRLETEFVQDEAVAGQGLQRAEAGIGLGPDDLAFADDKRAFQLGESHIGFAEHGVEAGHIHFLLAAGEGAPLDFGEVAAGVAWGECS